MPTGKQARFAALVVSGLNPSEAYREAGYKVSAMTSKAVANEAWRLARNPDISRMIEDGRREAMKNASWSLSEAMRRLEAVNDRCYRELTAGDAEKRPIDREALRGFLDTAAELNRLACVDCEVEAERERRYEGADTARERAMRKREAEDAELSIATFGL